MRKLTLWKMSGRGKEIRLRDSQRGKSNKQQTQTDMAFLFSITGVCELVNASIASCCAFFLFLRVFPITMVSRDESTIDGSLYQALPCTLCFIIHSFSLVSLHPLIKFKSYRKIIHYVNLIKNRQPNHFFNCLFQFQISCYICSSPVSLNSYLNRHCCNCQPRSDVAVILQDQYPLTAMYNQPYCADTRHSNPD
jgi:hypothetical protein